MAHIAVIGAGPAGCAAADQLARGGHAVTLFEAGPPVAATQRWPLVGDATRAAYIGGTGLGGSSAINGAVLAADGEPVPTGVPTFVMSPDRIGAALKAATPAAALQVVGRDGTRFDVAEALGLLESSLTVRSSCRVERILVDGSTVNGVRTATSDVAADAVVIAAGAVGTPIILGDSEIAWESGRGADIGLGLRDHRCLTIVLDGIADRDLGGVRASASVAAEIDGGVLVAVDSFGMGSGVGGILIVCDTPSRGGRVSRSAQTGVPTVDLGTIDLEPLKAVWSAARPVVQRLARDWPGKVLIDEWGTPLDRITDDGDRVASWIRRSAGGAYHAVGTCRSVVDADGRLRGLNGAVVAGAAILAEPPRWPMAACIVDGRRAARVVADDLERGLGASAG